LAVLVSDGDAAATLSAGADDDDTLPGLDAEHVDANALPRKSPNTSGGETRLCGKDLARNPPADHGQGKPRSARSKLPCEAIPPAANTTTEPPFLPHFLTCKTKTTYLRSKGNVGLPPRT
jgi:hypothetical protein